MSRKNGGNGPTSSDVIRDVKTGTFGFTSHDPAHGARVNSAPSYYDKYERWKQKISEEDLMELIRCVLLQHYEEIREYKIPAEIVEKLGCPEKFGPGELRWLKSTENYDFFSRQIRSEYLLKLVRR